MNNKISKLQCTLTTLFVTALLISNIVVCRTIALPFGITMTAGIFIFPITYILSDLFSEVYGYKWSRITCYMAFAMNLLMVAVFSLTMIAPSVDTPELANAFKMVLGNSSRMLVASVSAFLCGDFINDKVFAKMKEKHIDSHKGFKVRAILSSILGTFVDTSLVMVVGFLGQMPLSIMATIIFSEICAKTLYEIMILPITTRAVHWVSSYEKRHK